MPAASAEDRPSFLIHQKLSEKVSGPLEIGGGRGFLRGGPLKLPPFQTASQSLLPHRATRGLAPGGGYASRSSSGRRRRHAAASLRRTAGRSAASPPGALR